MDRCNCNYLLQTDARSHFEHKKLVQKKRNAWNRNECHLVGDLVWLKHLPNSIENYELDAAKPSYGAQ